MADVPVNETAFEQRKASFWVLILGKWEDPAHKQIVVDYIKKCHKIVSKYSEGIFI